MKIEALEFDIDNDPHWRIRFRKVVWEARGSLSDIVIDTKGLSEQQVRKILNDILGLWFLYDCAVEKIQIKFGEEQLTLIQAVKFFFPIQSTIEKPFENTFATAMIVSAALTHNPRLLHTCAPQLVPCVNYVMSHYDGFQTGEVGFRSNFDPYQGNAAQRLTFGFTTKENKIFLILSRWTKIVLGDEQLDKKNINKYPNVHIFPDGIYHAEYPQVSKFQQIKIPWNLNYLPPETEVGPFILFDEFYFPINTSETGGGVLLAMISSGNVYGDLPKLFYNGVNGMQKFIDTCNSFNAINFKILGRKSGFSQVEAVLAYLPFPKEIAVCLLIHNIASVFGLIIADCNQLVRLLGPGHSFKSKTMKFLYRLLTGKTELCLIEDVNIKSLSGVAMALIDEVGAEIRTKKREDAQEKQLLDHKSSSMCRLILQGGRSAPSDENTVTKSLDYDMSSAHEYAKKDYTEENAMCAAIDLRDPWLSYFIPLISQFLYMRKTGGVARAIQQVKANYPGHVKLRLADALGVIHTLLYTIEPDMLAAWGEDFSADNVFAAFMAYQEKVGQKIQADKNVLVAGIYHITTRFLSTGSPRPNGLHFVKTKRQISGSLVQWATEISALHTSRDVPFKHVDDLLSKIRATADLMQKSGWIFNFGYRANNRPGLAVIIPTGFERDLTVSDDSAEEGGEV